MKGLPLLLALLSGPALANCDVPDEGNAPLHRAVTRVKYLPETDALVASFAREPRAAVQFVLSLDSAVRIGGRCYWPLEVRADGKRWNSFLVSPDGKRVLVAQAEGKPLSLDAWRRQSARK